MKGFEWLREWDAAAGAGLVGVNIAGIAVLRTYPKTLIVILRSVAVPAKAGKDLSLIETVLNSSNGAFQKDPSLRSG